MKKIKERMTEIEAAQVEISWTLVPCIGHAIKMLEPTFPKMQLHMVPH